MLKALSSAATGMIAQQMNIDVISNNVANVNTQGYKKSRIEFQSLFSEQIRVPGALGAQGTNIPVGIEIGLGVTPAATQKLFGEGTLKNTGNSKDMAIEGDGFFQVQLDDGTIAYTRDGSFKADANGTMTTTNGYVMQPQITIPQDGSQVAITDSGSIGVKIGNEQNQTEVGQVETVRFQNPAGLISIGKNLYIESPASGQPIQGTPGQEGFGTIQQGFIEGSNVQMVEELVNLIEAERAFEANSKIITSSSQILQQTNQIR